MKVIFPFTGRLPLLMSHTEYMLTPPEGCEGHPILAHLLDPLCELPISEFIFIGGYQEDKIRAYMEANYSGLAVSFVEQGEEKGLGYTVSLASDRISNEPVLIVDGERVLNMNWTVFTQSGSSMIAVLRIVDEKPYGLVELREGIVGCLIQKPQRTDLVIAGCYFVRESQLLFRCLRELIQVGHRRHGEYQLTNALQRMIESGVEIEIQEVSVLDEEKPNASRNFFSTELEVFNGVER